MGLLGKIWVKLGLDNSDYKRGIKESQTATSKFKSYIKTVGAGLLAAFSVRTVFNFAKNAVKAYNEAAESVAKLESQLRATNNAVGLSSRELQQYATDLQRVTMFGDETTMDAMSKLLSFSSIQGEVFKKTIASAQDMATILKTDLQSAILQLGKALEDPNMGLTLLRRSGVIFTQEQMDHIRKLVDAGKKYEAQMIILAEVQKKFGGAAQAAADTSGGAWKQLSNAIGDLMEVIGSGTEKTKGFAKRITEYVQALTTTFSSSSLGWVDKILALFNPQIIIRATLEAKKLADQESRRNDIVSKMIGTLNGVRDAEDRLGKLQRNNLNSTEKLYKKQLESYIQTQSIIEGDAEDRAKAEKKAAEEAKRKIAEEAALLGDGLIPQLEAEIREKEKLLLFAKDQTAIRVINDEIDAIKERLKLLRMTTEEYNKASEVTPTRRFIANAIPAAPSAPASISGRAMLGTDNYKRDFDNILSYVDKFNRDLQTKQGETEDIGRDIAYALSSSIGGAINDLVTSLMETGKVDTASVANALMQPFFDMAGQLGQVLIAAGLGSESLKSLITNPALAIAAGAALVALSAAASAAFSSAVSNRGGASSMQTDPYAYSGGMSSVSLSPAAMSVSVTGRISGQDIYLSNKRTAESKRR